MIVGGGHNEIRFIPLGSCFNCFLIWWSPVVVRRRTAHTGTSVEWKKDTDRWGDQPTGINLYTLNVNLDGVDSLFVTWAFSLVKLRLQWPTYWWKTMLILHLCTCCHFDMPEWSHWKINYNVLLISGRRRKEFKTSIHAQDSRWYESQSMHTRWIAMGGGLGCCEIDKRTAL